MEAARWIPRFEHRSRFRDSTSERPSVTTETAFDFILSITKKGINLYVVDLSDIEKVFEKEIAYRKGM